MSEKLTDDRLREIKERAEKATKGPWVWKGHYLMQDCLNAYGFPEDGPWNTPHGTPIADDGSACEEYAPVIDIDGPDAHFIAHARTDIPDLLAEVERLSNGLKAEKIGHNAECEAYMHLLGDFHRLRAENERLKGYFNKMEAVLNSDKYAYEKFDAVRKYINLSQIRIDAALTESEGAADAE